MSTADTAACEEFNIINLSISEDHYDLKSRLPMMFVKGIVRLYIALDSHAVTLLGFQLALEFYSLHIVV